MARRSRRRKVIARRVKAWRSGRRKNWMSLSKRIERRRIRKMMQRKRNPQIARFPDGGFVLHKITGNWKGNVSAWFDKNGRPLDAEQMSGGFGSPARRVKRGGPIWDRLETIGKVWK